MEALLPLLSLEDRLSLSATCRNLIRLFHRTFSAKLFYNAVPIFPVCKMVIHWDQFLAIAMETLTHVIITSFNLESRGDAARFAYILQGLHKLTFLKIYIHDRFARTVKSYVFALDTPQHMGASLSKSLTSLFWKLVENQRLPDYVLLHLLPHNYNHRNFRPIPRSLGFIANVHAKICHKSSSL